MVRPRVGDFKYSRTELDVMIEDIMTFKELGVLGVVFGVLTVGGRVDIERTKWFDTPSDNIGGYIYIINIGWWKLPGLCKVCL